ncbi:A/G-specific DNA-adenine glycosylase [Malonomonas rubra DSM 5091]|uniref:Adenine DNA glycosylase n=1 Tax=Malonomonas rubra DSM 5091 TaxID=1122189 RepID=A0A1M6HKT6_MALRU|nr:A/G-specific adenine glycosylase [Malonomonas rubra]SHJ22796.1 A/G-specific DNA-adenine glycosylase [Malonomonas rubra DSM 5091]
MAELPFPAEAVAKRLLQWYGREGRDLPWRQTDDPYRIWLSEIMLQQTTVAAVVGYYQRFLDNFPSIEHLASAPQEAVIDLWAGLGYYARARNLHAAAKVVVEQFSGVFPQTVDELQQLPGVGRSTAGAIAALAFAQRAPILDGNVRRILCRLFALQQPPRSSAAEKQLWVWADLLTPAQHVHDYTQAIMDLGATVCLPRKPLCGQCPLRELCQAQRLGLAQQLPLKQKSKPLPTRREAAMLLEWKGRYLVRRRPASGLLGGLWEFPTISLSGEETAEQQLKRLMLDFSVRGKLQQLGNINHIYSHFRLDLQLFRLSVDEMPLVGENENNWYQREQLHDLALHGAHKKAVGKIPITGE